MTNTRSKAHAMNTPLDMMGITKRTHHDRTKQMFPCSLGNEPV